MTVYRTGQLIPFQLGAPPFWYNRANPNVIVLPEYGHNGGYRVVQVSRNLRGLITRAFKVGVGRVSISKITDGPDKGGSFVYVGFNDGSELRTVFADHSVARRFFLSRQSRWDLQFRTDNFDSLWLFSTDGVR